MNAKKVPLSALQGSSITFKGDVHELARWLLNLDLARSTPAHGYRHTVHGLANHYAFLTGMDLEQVRRRLAATGFDLGATIEPDEDIAGQP